MAQELHAPTIPADLGESTRSGYNVKFLAGGAVLLAFVAFLIFQMVQATLTTGAYYMTVSEVHDAGPKLIGQRIRVNGNVVPGTEDWNAQEVTLKFSIADESVSDSGQVLPIVYYGPRPDNFQRAASAIVEGQLLPDGTFEAQTLLLKCPSRYDEEPEEVFCDANGCRTVE
jgi:cytochrome c-type biogenesis protein CcmE